MEIFGAYGPVKQVDIPPDHVHPYLSRGYANIEFDSAEDADKAQKHMDGGQLDGKQLTCEIVAPPVRRAPPPPHRRSPPRGGGERRRSPYGNNNPNRIPLGRRSRSPR